MSLEDEKGTTSKDRTPGPGSYEGCKGTPLGPVIMFGLGGILTEIFADVTFRMVPLSWEDAGEMPEAIKGRKLLNGYRNMPAVDREALQELIFKTSQICWENPWIHELDLNPVLLHAKGLKVVDARII